MKDPYRTLGVESDATQEEIKKEYRRLAIEHHPDAGGDKEKFKDIQEAGEILADPESRKEYDETGDYRPGDELPEVKIVLQYFMKSFTEGDSGTDIKSQVLNMLWTDRRAMAQSVQYLKIKLENMNEQLSRFEKTNQDSEMFGVIKEAMQSGIASVEADLKKVKSGIAIHEKATSIVRDGVSPFGDVDGACRSSFAIDFFGCPGP